MRIAFVVNGTEGSPMGYRARRFACHLGGGFDSCVFYRPAGRVRGIYQFLAALLRERPAAVYVLDMAYSGVLAGVAYKRLTGRPLVIDTGDAIGELAVSMGRGRVGVQLTRWLESLSLRSADRLVVRGTVHKEWLAARGVDAQVIQDGVETDLFRPLDVPDLRRELGLDGMLTVGLVGSVVWSERLRTCYGWDLIELMRLLKHEPVAGVLIGDGSGLAVLQDRCREYGVGDKVRFLGRVPYEELPRHLNLIDVALSTQTDDLVGRVRTTGKLPLFLATGRYVLASRVGEAALVLPDEMLVDYEGQVDPAYPDKLAGRVRGLLREPELLERGKDLVDVARSKFDYAVQVSKVRGVLEGVTGRARQAACAVGEKVG